MSRSFNISFVITLFNNFNNTIFETKIEEEELRSFHTTIKQTDCIDLYLGKFQILVDNVTVLIFNGIRDDISSEEYENDILFSSENVEHCFETNSILSYYQFRFQTYFNQVEYILYLDLDSIIFFDNIGDLSRDISFKENNDYLVYDNNLNVKEIYLDVELLISLFMIEAELGDKKDYLLRSELGLTFLSIVSTIWKIIIKFRRFLKKRIYPRNIMLKKVLFQKRIYVDEIYNLIRFYIPPTQLIDRS